MNLKKLYKNIPVSHGPMSWRSNSIPKRAQLDILDIMDSTSITVIASLADDIICSTKHEDMKVVVNDCSASWLSAFCAMLI